MGSMDKLRSVVEEAAGKAGRELDKGKTKVSELQVRTRMDAAAKRLGYAVYDAQRGRDADPAMQASLIEELGRLEAELAQIREKASAKAAT